MFNSVLLNGRSCLWRSNGGPESSNLKKSLNYDESLNQLAELERLCFSDFWPKNELAAMLDLPYSFAQIFYASTSGEKIVPIGYVIYWQVVDEVQLHRFGIHPERRGCGSGKVILADFCGQWCEISPGKSDASSISLQTSTRSSSQSEANYTFNNFCSKITLEVRENNAPALAVYRAVGFEEVGRRPNYYHDTHEAAVLMDKCIFPHE
ncbi:hypothetical protein B7R76_02630 [Mageeibacillus indolicus]|uniref:N-acetyltransferase domain-containing protein n=1 Tax=Mageeibacillus indolicus TaxID=884684 RepID=A0A2J8B4T9_9FIRM|nr:GNAT family N-acetyltransferase [Mageeibacillus indolicus]PNH19791.1 hypothetical protein B7R76_02630 [Mageeibacillus indolicus]